MKKMAGILISMVLPLSLTACTGQSPAADAAENEEGTALGASSVSSVESERGDISERQEEPTESSFAEEGIPSEGGVSSEETLSFGSYPYDSVFPRHEPYGQGVGAMPGRVVWVYDTDSVLWDGDGYWWKPDNFDEKVIQDMVNDSIASLGGEETAKDGWNGLFLAHNMARDKGSIGYAAGEKIVIKANINGSGVFDDDTSGETQMSYTNPVLLKTLLVSLVEEAGVSPSDIAVYDVSRLFPDYMVDLCTEGILDGVHFVDRRNSIADENVPINWSYEFSGAVNYLPTCVTEADYMINLANLKGHSYGITLCGKNHFGSFINGNTMRPPEGANLHQFLIRNEMDRSNVENYLHEAGLVGNAPSGNVYQNGNGETVTNLGVHEHWNNSVEKLYSRNLGEDEGIELVCVWK